LFKIKIKGACFVASKGDMSRSGKRDKRKPACFLSTKENKLPKIKEQKFELVGELFSN
jgi:hypothetical protein